MKKWLYHIIFCVLILASMPVQAKIIRNLYQMQIPVSSQAASLRNQAIRQALQDVLIKVSGNSQILNNDTVSNALAKADNYMQQYSYVQAPLQGQQAINNPNASQLNLQVIFDPQQIRQLLQSANQPIWGRDRPIVLLWVALDNGQNQQLLNINSADPTVSMLQQIGKQRGAPLAWPAVPGNTAPINTDPDNTVGIADVWQPNVNKIQRLSQAYNDNVILIMRLTNDSGQWAGQWTLLIDNQQLTWQANGEDEWTVLQQGMNQAIDAIAQRYAVQGQAQKQQITITINNLATLGGYVQAEKYLQQLTPISHVELKQIDADAVQFNVTYEGSQNDLMSTIKLDKKLLFINPQDSDFNSTLNYQWQ